MKAKKSRPAKGGTSKKKVPSDVSPSTGLPPLVEGQLRCFLRVTISRVLWTIHKPPPVTLVRLRWWGESSNGTYFCPRDGAQISQKAVKTTARFPIRCGPKQFTSYLTDMGSLVLEVQTKPDHLPIARGEVAGISRLSLSHSINGFYTLVSPTSEKLGELQVSLSLEALTEAYDSSSSVPTTDISIEAPQLTTPMPSSPRHLSVNTEKESAGSSNGNTPRGRDNVYFQRVQSQTDKRKEESMENQMPATDRSQERRPVVSPSSQRTHHGQTSNDILSVILERGSKLRNAMVVSAMKYDVDDLALKDTHLPLPKDNILPFSKSSPPSRGTFLQNILHAELDSDILHSSHAAMFSANLNPDSFADTENRAVDLLLGSFDTSPILILDGNSLLPESLSGHSSVCGDSELYDQSLLENLFYKNPMLDVGTGATDMEGEKSTSQKQITDQEIEVQKPGHGNPTEDSDALSGLGMDQLTVLGGIRLARVTIHSLTAPTDSTATTTSIRDKPPRPLVNKKCSYFVEYMLPVASTSSRHDHGQVMAGEVTRVVSSKVTGGVVKFQQSCVFPVRLSGTTIEQWWGTDLVFKIYSRKINQKKPVPVGKAVYPLRSVLLSKELSQTVVLSVESLEGTNVCQDIGPLKVSLELATDNRDFSSTKGRLAERARSPSHAVSNPQREPSPVQPQHVERPPNSPRVSRLDVRPVQRDLEGHVSLSQSHQHLEEATEVLLHALLMVPDGKNFNSGSLQAPNFYLNCKLLGSDETARSAISWGQTNPCFNFVQVTPVALTTKLLERMKNNVVVIEVWHRTGGSGEDRLIGLVKLPLHQFYMSFRDTKITHLLLQAQYPVLGVDCYMPVIDVFSGSCKGMLRVLLAMGKSEQIVALQRMRDEEFGSVSHHTRPVHLLDHQPYSQTKGSTSPQQAMREHLFVIRVEKVQGLTPLQSTVWGEADCYIQYSFPSQEGHSLQNMDPNLIESSVNLMQFRTTTTLCVPDPMFDHSETHVLVAPAGVPVQRLLLSSLSSQGLANGGGIQFEVWCRYYYPNVRDQLVAKGMLPLSKLCAMVTMQKRQPDEAQVFSLPLVPKIDSPSGRQPQPSGLLDVCIQYKHRPARPEGQRVGVVASRLVTLVVQIHRVSGLQAAARALSERDENLQYYADVGVNAYVTVQLSFLPSSEQRSTRVAARTFCPEFDYHTEFPCEMQLQRSSGEICSLAELLQEASAIFYVWNRDSRKVTGSLKSEDALLGTVKIPLADLVHKRTGISGWFGVYVPQVLGSSHDHHIMVGGLEISINFAHHSDRERVNKVSQVLGWEVDQRELDKQDDDDDDEEQAWETPKRTMSLSILMPRAWLPVRCLLLPGHSELQRSTYCYFRYKLYDHEAFCSQMKHPSLEEDGKEGLATVEFQGSRAVELRGSQPLLWYLREEKLEVQLWVAFRKDRTCRPHDTDRLVGSAFVDLSSLTKRPGNKLTISGVYPLFSRSAPDFCGAAIRVHITVTTGSLPEEPSTENNHQGELSSGEEDQMVEGLSSNAAVAASRPSGTQERQQSKSFMSEEDPIAPQCTDISLEESFAVTITVDRAMHLSLKGCPLAERGAGLPCCFVSYSTDDSEVPVSTAVVANTDCPVWDHHQECRLSKQLLVDPQQALVFKVWHKGEMERVIGFASVDLSPLLSGFQSVCGWYNITDFSGQCHGQVKVSIMPLMGVQTFRGQRRAMSEDDSKNSPALFRAHPLSYHTTATYKSFPSHISLYPEQKIRSPEHIDGLFCERTSESDRHGEHMDNVRLYHQSLQEQAEAHHSDIRPSSSVLFSALRKNLSELDDIQRYFSRKLSTPTFPPLSEQQVCRSRQEEHQDSDTHSHQLLLKSTQLVGEVNSIISSLPGHCLETISSNSHSRSKTPPSPKDHRLPINSHDLLSEIVDHQHSVAESPLEAVSPGSPLPSALPRTSEDNMDSDEEGELADSRKEEEEEVNGEGDYEETVMEQRPVNEVTSLTDKTSPWTSVLSDPDSQENLGELEEQPSSHQPDLTLDGSVWNRPFSPQNDTLCPQSLNEAHSCESPSEQFDSSRGSMGDLSDTERGGQATPVCLSDSRENPGELEGQPSSHHHDLTQDESASLGDVSDTERGAQETPPQATGKEEGLEPGSTMSDTGDGSPQLENEPPRLSADPLEAINANKTCPPYSVDAQPQISAHVEIPNFFLPSHHLEASMRALRLAPAFTHASTNQGSSFVRHAIPYRRAPRPRPNIPAASMTREETERIAKIFSAHFNEES